MFLFALVVAQNSNASGNSLHFRMRRFLSRPLHEKSRSLYARWRQLFPSAPFLIRLPFGSWFIARDDYLGATFTSDSFEPAERAFMQRYLKPGMTVLDIGAHHGLYSLLAAKQVGEYGRVYSFEPSPREQKALKLNLLLNRCKNVKVQQFALGSEETNSDLYVVNEFNTGCNSLRPPHVPHPTSAVTVNVKTLDNWIAEQKLQSVDFIKLDVEGGELEALKGAQRTLQTRPRPIIMCEMEDIRTAPWGYKPDAIALHLLTLGFRWFQPTVEGNLSPLPADAHEFQSNYVAVPEETVPLIASAHP